MTLDDEELSYRARALAQAHPLTAGARRYVEAIAEQQRRSQPFPEIALWASVSLVQGYCVRRVEEEAAGAAREPPAESALERDDLDLELHRVVEDLRSGDASVHLLLDEAVVLRALDRVIGSELRRRLEAGDQASETAQAELGEFVTWCVLHGYALRIVEAAPADLPA